MGKTHLRRVLILAACTAAVLAAAGCTKRPAHPTPQTAAIPTKFNTDIPMKEVMGDIVDPAAWTYWHASGTEVTAQGEKDLAPTKDEDWIPVENAAGVLVEAGNLLQLPGRARAPEADWNRYAQQLTERAMAARVAAEKHDKQGVFDEGGRVYEVCTACHKQFVIEPQLKAQGGPGTSTLAPFPNDIEKKIEKQAGKSSL